MSATAPLQSIIIVATGEPDHDRIDDIHALARRHASETHLLNEQALAEWLGRADADSEPAVLIFAPSLERPAGLARTARQRWSRCELLFVREPSTLADFRRQLGMAPMLGIHWAVVPDDDTLEDVLALASQTARRRARLRTTLDTANLSLPSRPDSQAQKRQAMADHYLANFIDFAQEAIVGLDADQQVMFWSAGAEELFGLPSAVAAGQDARSLRFWNSDLDEALRALSAGKRSVLVESTLLQDASR
ncbi:hypothetical protein NAV33_18320 [Pseudomonas stutzeri]|uniref:hypothetical protein n=1 Tax=Stutzerimonas stutzeri TaxID=316 RepID=UPI00210A3B83|nr:hypothetical protein [Stutzerimonas stutzeri]MCQ4313828.1 hypothetical protein [Stutzerimonas stutzeri]